MMAGCSQEVSKLMVPLNTRAGASNHEAYDTHERPLGVVHTIYEDYVDELLCRETSSEGSCCSYTDLFNVGDYEITNASINLAFSELPSCPPSHCNLQSSILAWCDATGLPTTVSIHVAGKVFKLHKFPMVSLSGFMKRELMEVEEVHLDKGRWWPGGAESFEVAASFCYGGRVVLSPTNVAVVRCAAEVLEMSEEYTQGNLARHCDIYLRQVALRRWSQTLLVLQQCRSLRPLAESLLIVAQCINAIATMACGQAANAVEIHPLDDMHTTRFPATYFPASSDIAHSSSLPIIQLPATDDIGSTAPQTLPGSNCFCYPLQQLADDQLAWIHDLAELPHYHFSQIITAARRLGMKDKHIMVTLLQYAEKSIFSCFEVLEDGALMKKKVIAHAISCCSNKNDGTVQQDEIIEKIEAMVALLHTALSCNEEAEGRARFPMIRFLFALLKCTHACGGMANECKQKLECMIEKRLKDARISDFELPCSLLGAGEGGGGRGGGSHCCRKYRDKNARVYSEDQRRRRDKKEVESMLHIISLFFSRLHVAAGEHEDEILCAQGRPEDVEAAAAQVAAVWDEYVAEAAADQALSVRRFVELVEMVPPSARPSHDRLYSTIDSFLQSHSNVSPQERQAVCKMLNCQRLSREYCIQAVQNEAMPLRIIVQAMFMHQLNATTTTTISSTVPLLRRSASCHHHQQQQQGNTPNSTRKKKTQQLGSLLKGNTVEHCQSTPVMLDDMEVLRTRLLTLEDEIQQLKRGLAGFTFINSHPITPPTSQERGWRRRFTCLGLLRHAYPPSPTPPMGGLPQHPPLSLPPSGTSACCLLPPVTQPSSSITNQHYHSF